MTSRRGRPGLTVGLMWHSVTSDNLGVGALTESQLRILEACAQRLQLKLTYVIFGTEGDLNYAPPNVSVNQGARLSIRQLLLGRFDFVRDVDRCDVVLDIGEGDSFTDIYGIRRFVFQLLSKVVVLIRRKPLILSPQTIGPFTRWWIRVLAFQTMRRCDRVFARDRQSRQYLLANGLVANAGESIDVAFRLPYERGCLPASRKVRVGVNVSGLLMAGSCTKVNQFGLAVEYRDLVHGLLDEWSRDAGVEVWLIPHVLSNSVPEEDDRRAIEDVLQKYPMCRSVDPPASPSAAKSVIASMSFVTGARMHACIAAFSAGVPVVPFAYSRKFTGLFESLGYPWVVDGRTATTAMARQMIMDGFTRRDELAVLVAKGNRVVDGLLENYENYIVETLLRVSCLGTSATERRSFKQE